MLSSIGIATETVLGRENRHDVHAILEHQIQRVLVAHHTRLIAQQSHTFALEQGHIGIGTGSTEHNFAASLSRNGRLLFTGRRGALRCRIHTAAACVQCGHRRE